jgi:hypothetical protein
LLNFAMISRFWASVKQVASSFIRFPLRFIEAKGLESDMNKVCIYHATKCAPTAPVQSAYLSGRLLDNAHTPVDEGLTDDSQTFILLYGKGGTSKMPIFMVWER